MTSSRRTRPVRARSPRARQRMPRVPAARRRLGLEQRRARRRRRCLAARRHAVRPAADAGDARRDGAGHRDGADRDARQHARQRRPLLRQPARRRARRSSRRRATAHEMAEVPPSMMAALNNAPGDVGELFRSFFGEFEFDGIDVAHADAHVRRRARRRGRRTARRADRGRPGAHRGRHDRLRARRADDLHRRHPLHQRHADRVGRAAVELGRGVRPDARRWTSTPSSPATVRSPTRRASREVRDYLAFVDEEATARHDAGVDAWDAAQRDRPRDRGAPGVRGLGRVRSDRRSTSRRCTARSTRTHVSPNVVEQFRRMAQIECGRRAPASTATGDGRPTRAVIADVVVVGDGPAGLALGAACVDRRARRSRRRQRAAVDGDVRDVGRRRARATPSTFATHDGRRRHHRRRSAADRPGVRGVRQRRAPARASTSRRTTLADVVGVEHDDAGPQLRSSRRRASGSHGRLVVDATGSHPVLAERTGRTTRAARSCRAPTGVVVDERPPGSLDG